MKYFIVGLHASGKQEVNDILKEHGVKCGNIFTNLKKDEYNAKNIYNNNYEYYDISEINKIFENNAYIFIHDIPGIFNVSAFKYFEGLSKYEFDNNDVFVLSPDQVLNIVPSSIKEPICFVWLDNKKSNRKSRYIQENRTYNFNEREAIEKHDINAFVKSLYNTPNSCVLYFTDEEPDRVSAIIYSAIKHPDLLDIYKKTFI